MIFHFHLIFMKIKKANRIAPSGAPRFAAPHLVLFCLPMSHKKDARLICVWRIRTLKYIYVSTDANGLSRVIRKHDFSIYAKKGADQLRAFVFNTKITYNPFTSLI